ncbi:MAG: VWA domain-containing protein [Myxococcales bacterium]|nr:VWA domain-containing protein [Myxococcales bacterium]
MSHEHERPVEPFSDLHVEHGHVRATLLHDPSVEGLDVGLYLDGSGSMNDEYKSELQTTGGGLLWDLFGWGVPPITEMLDNKVEPQARWMLKYLASKDRNGQLRVAYWACGQSGSAVEVLGELAGTNVYDLRFPGPQEAGARTVLTPALRDYIKYLELQTKDGCKRGCCVILTDGQIHDIDDVHAFSADVAKRIARGSLPRTNFILVGVGDGVDEEQLEKLAHVEYTGIGHLWCHRIAEEIHEIAELVAVLVDETMTVAAGGTIYDDKGTVVRLYEGRLPAVLEFEVPEGAKSFTLEVNGQRYTQPLPAEEDEDHPGEEGKDEDHH